MLSLEIHYCKTIVFENNRFNIQIKRLEEKQSKESRREDIIKGTE